MNEHLLLRLAVTEDIDRLNEIANHPEVLPTISDGTPLDFRASPPTMLTFISPLGAIFFTPHGQAWEFHTVFLPEGKGRHAVNCLKSAINTMFDKFNSSVLVTYSTDDYPNIRPPKSFGFKQTGYKANYIRGVGATLWTLKKEDYYASTSHNRNRRRNSR